MARQPNAAFQGGGASRPHFRIDTHPAATEFALAHTERAPGFQAALLASNAGLGAQPAFRAPLGELGNDDGDD